MAQNNLARQAVQHDPLQELPQRPLHTQTAPQIATRPRRLTFSKFEKCLLTTCGLVVMGLCVWLVSLQIGVSTAQQQLQDINTKITTTQNQNTNHRQQINELLNRTRLEQIAKKNGMSLSNGKIRNVNK